MTKLLLIDLRDKVDYDQFYVYNSINVPFDTISLDLLGELNEILLDKPGIDSSAHNGDLSHYLMYTLQQNSNALKVIYSSQETFGKAVELANNLVRLKISRVCLIKSGIESFITTKIIYRQI